MIKPQDINGLVVADSLSRLPYIDQYAGAYCMYEPAFNALLGTARNLNINVHMERVNSAEGQAEIKSQAGSGLTVRANNIAIIELVGPMQKHVSSFSGGCSTVNARRQLRAAMDESIAGVLIHFDTPGGTVAGTHDLAADIAALAKKKPVYGHAPDLCASAGYWCAAECTKFFGGPTALIGSIGVFTVIYDLSKMAETEGIEAHVVRFGAFKGSGTPGTKVSEEQLAEMQRIIDGYGADFVNVVAKGRAITKTEAKQLADGRVHKGQDAVDLKLIDGVQSMDETFAQLIQATKQPSRGTKASGASQRTTTMSTETDAKVNELAVGELRATAPTIAQLREACPGASDSFLLKQVEVGASIEDAMKAHAAVVAKENHDLKAKLAEQEAAAKDKVQETDKPKAKAKGTAPLADAPGEDQATDGSAREQWDAQIAETMEKRKCNASDATRYVVRTNPELHAAMLAEANAGRKTK